MKRQATYVFDRQEITKALIGLVGEGTSVEARLSFQIEDGPNGKVTGATLEVIDDEGEAATDKLMGELITNQPVSDQFPHIRMSDPNPQR